MTITFLWKSEQTPPAAKAVSDTESGSVLIAGGNRETVGIPALWARAGVYNFSYQQQMRQDRHGHIY